jgi:hypothetical protein
MPWNQELWSPKPWVAESTTAARATEAHGKLAWASGPPTVSPNGKLLAIPLRKGVLVLDVEATTREGKLVSYKL